MYEGLERRACPTTDGNACPPIVALEQRMSERHARIEVMLAENTQSTKEVLDILLLGKSAIRIMGYVASFAKWVAGIAVALGAVWLTFKGQK